MINVAVLGYGTVGSGVVEVIEKNKDMVNKKSAQELEVKYILDLRDFPGDPVEKVLVHDYSVIVNDPEVKIIVEVMGGIKPAYDFTKQALEAGKSVCTSNKELVAAHGAELLAIAKANNVNFLFEASVGGGIPIIRPLNQSLTADEIAKEAGGFDFILADLGVSSMQIDNPERGFSFKVDGPLDLRLNQTQGISAAERLDMISREELAGMLYENSDEPYCEELAKAITDEIRKGHRIDTTTKLREVIEKTLDFLPEKEKKDTIKKTCQRTFQALRIDVNREFEVLYEFMEKLPGALKPGGRVAILTFHSGEDKLVKRALKEGCRDGIYADYSKDVVRPSAEECAQNGRARSTKMRWAIRAEE